MKRDEIRTEIERLQELDKEGVDKIIRALAVGNIWSNREAVCIVLRIKDRGVDGIAVDYLIKQEDGDKLLIWKTEINEFVRRYCYQYDSLDNNTFKKVVE